MKRSATCHAKRQAVSVLYYVRMSKAIVVKPLQIPVSISSSSFLGLATPTRCYPHRRCSTACFPLSSILLYARSKPRKSKFPPPYEELSSAIHRTAEVMSLDGVTSIQSE